MKPGPLCGAQLHLSSALLFPLLTRGSRKYNTSLRYIVRPGLKNQKVHGESGRAGLSASGGPAQPGAQELTVKGFEEETVRPRPTLYRLPLKSSPFVGAVQRSKGDTVP